jgi:hypothetical protein
VLGPSLKDQGSSSFDGDGGENVVAGIISIFWLAAYKLDFSRSYWAELMVWQSGCSSHLADTIPSRLVIDPDRIDTFSKQPFWIIWNANDDCVLQSHHGCRIAREVLVLKHHR